MVALNQTPVNPSFSTIPNPITANFTILTPVFVAILLMKTKQLALHFPSAFPSEQTKKLGATILATNLTSNEPG
jgi:hypothetical protein